MNRAPRHLTATAIVLMAVAGSACARQTPEEQARDVARRAAKLAVSPEQKRLWQQAADRGPVAGLERVPTPAQAVQRRVAAAPAAQPGTQQSVTLPSAQNSIEVLMHAVAPGQSFIGMANVVGVDTMGYRLQLNLGSQGMLTVLARVGGSAIPTRVGEQLQVAYQSREDPNLPRDLIAVQTKSGSGIAHAVRGGNERITLVVPLFGVTARQVGEAPKPAVEVRVGTAEPTTLGVGQITQVGDVWVMLVASRALSGAQADRVEGSPYVVNLLAWRVR